MKKISLKRWMMGFVVAAVIGSATEGRAEMVLSAGALFHDGMVLQRDLDVPIWGVADPGAEVSVSLDSVPVATMTADETGRWFARIGSHPHDGGVSHSLRISSADAADIVINDVVFGDVYLASGQSNMALVLGAVVGAAEEKASANYPLIRQIRMNEVVAETEQREPGVKSPWTACSPSTAGNFCAVAYFFAKNIYLETGVPVGVLFSAWGGKEIEYFLSPSGVESVPELSSIQQYNEEGGISTLHTIYNGMIAPLIPYGLRGAIWYQGENNRYDGDIYQQKMRALICGWRQNWGQGDFPFYYVQLPNYVITTGDWAKLRVVQARVLSETNTGMAVTIDVGEDDDIHPKNKQDPGYRLSLWALANDDQKNRVYSGPLYHSFILEGSQIRILFDHAEDGLMIGTKDSTNPVVTVSGPLQDFDIAGADRIFTNADAVIDHDTVIVSSPAVTAPVYVRYCQAAAPAGTHKLYNTAGLPASPFYTDQSYRLDVKNGGSTTLNLEQGAQVPVRANNAPAGTVFDRWIGVASEINDPNASSAIVTMPDHSLYIYATYRNTDASVYTLAVNSGDGDGTSKSNSILNIAADEPPAGYSFDQWGGDTQTVMNVYAPRTTLRMPAAPVAVTATYKVIDSVGDGIPDTWRANYFNGDGTTTNAQSSASADPDDDGFSNWDEFRAGTSPTNPASVLNLKGTFSASNVMIRFPSVFGHRYRLEETSDLSAPSWEPVSYNIFGDGKQKEIPSSLGRASAGFYRLRLQDE